MKVGLLIFDNATDHSLAEKVLRAARRYRQKFGEAPDTCYVHPSEFTVVPPGKVIAAQMLIGGIEVIPSSTALLHHFFVGCNEESSQ